MINATDLYFIIRYCDSKTDNYSKFYPNLQQVVWNWNERYQTEKIFYWFNCDVELQFEKLIITLTVCTDYPDEKQLTNYVIHVRDVTFNELIEQLNALKESAKSYIQEHERCN